MKSNFEIEAERIVQKLTLEELQEAAKIGIMLTLCLYGRAASTIKKTIQKETNNGKQE